MSQFYYFDGMIYPVLATAIKNFTTQSGANYLNILMDNVSTYSRPLTPEQYNNIADEISKRLIA